MEALLKVTGMSCNGCRLGVENAVRKVPGVLSVEACLETAQLTVDYDENKTALDDIKAAVISAGFGTE